MSDPLDPFASYPHAPADGGRGDPDRRLHEVEARAQAAEERARKAEDRTAAYSGVEKAFGQLLEEIFVHFDEAERPDLGQIGTPAGARAAFDFAKQAVRERLRPGSTETRRDAVPGGGLREGLDALADALRVRGDGEEPADDRALLDRAAALLQVPPAGGEYPAAAEAGSPPVHAALKEAVRTLYAEAGLAGQIPDLDAEEGVQKVRDFLADLLTAADESVEAREDVQEVRQALADLLAAVAAVSGTDPEDVGHDLAVADSLRAAREAVQAASERGNHALLEGLRDLVLTLYASVHASDDCPKLASGGEIEAARDFLADRIAGAAMSRAVAEAVAAAYDAAGAGEPPSLDTAEGVSELRKFVTDLAAALGEVLTEDERPGDDDSVLRLARAHVRRPPGTPDRDGDALRQAEERAAKAEAALAAAREAEERVNGNFTTLAAAFEELQREICGRFDPDERPDLGRLAEDGEAASQAHAFALEAVRSRLRLPDGEADALRRAAREAEERAERAEAETAELRARSQPPADAVGRQRERRPVPRAGAPRRRRGRTVLALLVLAGVAGGGAWLHYQSAENWKADRDAQRERADTAESLVRDRGAMIDDFRERAAAAEAEAANARLELDAARQEVRQVRSSSRSVVGALTSACQKMTARQRRQVPLCADALRRVCERVAPEERGKLGYCVPPR